MNFSEALAEIKNGKRLARAGWNGAEMFVFLVHGSEFVVNRPPLNTFYQEGTRVKYHAHIDVKTAQGYVVPWLASQADLLAEDWEVVIGVTCMNCNSEINGHGSKCDPCLERLSNG